MKKLLLMLSLAALASCAQADNQNTDKVTKENTQRKWLFTVFLTNAYVSDLNPNAPVDMLKIDKDWVLLGGESFEIDLNKETLKIGLIDLGYIDISKRGNYGTPLGVSNNVDLEIRLFSWHTVYVLESGPDDKEYETLYGLVLNGEANTNGYHGYKVIIPRREIK